MIRCTLVSGGTASQRAAAITGLRDPGRTSAVILEGAAPGGMPLIEDGGSGQPVVTIAAACPCCDAGLVMRVTLDRLVRRQPDDLFISLADVGHLLHLKQFLGAPPYAALLTLAPAVSCVGAAAD